MTDIATLCMYVIVLIVERSSLWTQSHDQVKKEFTSAVVSDIIPRGALYVLKFSVIWFLSMVPISDK